MKRRQHLYDDVSKMPQGMKECDNCNGSGICPRCGGKLDPTKMKTSKQIQCHECEDTGICPMCDGQGSF